MPRLETSLHPVYNVIDECTVVLPSACGRHNTLRVLPCGMVQVVLAKKNCPIGERVVASDVRHRSRAGFAALDLLLCVESLRPLVATVAWLYKNAGSPGKPAFITACTRGHTAAAPVNLALAHGWRVGSSNLKETNLNGA